MRIPRLPLILVSISPLISLYRAWQATEARVHGLMSNPEAQRQILMNAAFAGVVYVGLIAFCVWHLNKRTTLSPFKKGLWVLGMGALPVIFIPTYLVLHGR